MKTRTTETNFNFRWAPTSYPGYSMNATIKYTDRDTRLSFGFSKVGLDGEEGCHHEVETQKYALELIQIKDNPRLSGTDVCISLDKIEGSVNDIKNTVLYSHFTSLKEFPTAVSRNKTVNPNPIQVVESALYAALEIVTAELAQKVLERNYSLLEDKVALAVAVVELVDLCRGTKNMRLLKKPSEEEFYIEIPAAELQIRSD